MSWYRSLYWRIAVAFIACLALLLIVQGMLFVWMMSQAGSSVPNQPPDRLAQTIVLDVAQAIERDPSLDVERYVRQEFASDTQPFLLALVDGSVVEIGSRFPEAFKQEARARLDTLKTVDPARLGRGFLFGRGGPFRGDRNRVDGRGRQESGEPQPERGPPAPDSDRRRGPGVEAGPPVMPPDARRPFDERRQSARAGAGAFRGGRPWPIVANGRLVGLVVVPPEPPFTYLLTRYAPTLLSVAGVTLVVGSALAALVIFGPARRRLKGVEDAARRLGAGDLSARAPDGGNDEVAAVASAFNAMAHDLAARNEALVAADRLRRQLLADVSHELNTPVTAMRGYLETLAMPELALDEATRARYLGIVGDEATRLERIIGDLLDLARLEGGGGTLQVEPIQVEELFDRVAARHERAANAAGVTIRSTVSTGAGVVQGDRTRLEQALQNLAANALRYAPAGTVVELAASRTAGGITLTVSDQGPGIAADHLPRVFDRFYKVDESRAAQTGTGGSGLGLSIVKAIVERHGGRISVTSAPGRTVFTISGLSERQPQA